MQQGFVFSMTPSGQYRDITSARGVLPCTGACLDTEGCPDVSIAVSAEQRSCMTANCSAEGTNRVCLLTMSRQATVLAGLVVVTTWSYPKSSCQDNVQATWK